MCGRVGFFSDGLFINDVQAVLGDFVNDIGYLTPHYNIAPSQALAALLNNHHYTETSFGLIPHWAKDRKRQLINARAETINDKPMFRGSFRHKRALIPVNGFYEWHQEGGHKQPYWIHPTESDYFALGAIWDKWYDNEQEKSITTSAIITTASNELMEPIHDRMPVIIPKESWGLWLDSEVQEPEALYELLQPCGSDRMVAYKVSTRVNSPVNDDAELLAPMSPETLF
ncbi:SOS response-associated peptidase [Sulfurimonas sp. HSL3-7]|uniref:SOS response-associated peptidase n=1 Tax=Sulfonitrofixus jiaomeiensis TaxID=3131938 RepID=UPI0031F9D6E4